MFNPRNNVKKSLIAGALVLSQTIWLMPMPALADDAVRIAGQQVFAVAGGKVSASTVQNNLDNALVAATDKTPSAVNITYVNGVPVVTLGGYQVVTVDAATAKAANGSPAVVAKKWADAIRNSLVDQTSINDYVSQLQGNYASSAPAPESRVATQPPPTTSYQEPANLNVRPQGQYNGNAAYTNAPPPQYGGQQPQYGGMQGGGQPQYGGNQMMQGRVAYAPAGLVLPITLKTSISTQVAKPGDLIEAQLSQPMILGDAQIPQGSSLTGSVVDSEAGRRLSRSGELQIKFTMLRTPDGAQTPISAHLIGGIGKYTGKGTDEAMRGEGWTAKLGQTAIRGGVGAGTGAALGTALGAIAGRSGGAVGRGAWGGAAIGGGVGMATMLLRHGRDVIIPSGTNMQLQLDAPVTVAGAAALAGGGTYPRYGSGL